MITCPLFDLSLSLSFGLSVFLSFSLSHQLPTPTNDPDFTRVYELYTKPQKMWNSIPIAKAAGGSLSPFYRAMSVGGFFHCSSTVAPLSSWQARLSDVAHAGALLFIDAACLSATKAVVLSVGALNRDRFSPWDLGLRTSGSGGGAGGGGGGVTVDASVLASFVVRTVCFGCFALSSLSFFGHAIQIFWAGLAGVRLPSLMSHPEAALSLAEFWGRRWNRVIHLMLKDYAYLPAVTAGLGRTTATALAFLL